MTREQKVDITLEELDREITIATYQEKQVRKCLAAAFARIESETAAGGGEMPLPSDIDENTVESGFRSMDKVLRLLERLSQKQLDCIYFVLVGILGTVCN